MVVRHGDVSGLRRDLLAWYARHRRVLPWREAEGGGRHPDSYAVWVSEVMLQQTQVATVLPYFERWMARFPDLGALAEAPIEAVLACWQGLGYYSRARNLHRAAREIVLRHAGRLPEDAGALRRLPGVGEYTAGAVASIAFGQPVPAIDGNARRVLARWAGVEGDPSRAPASRTIRRLAEQLVQGPRPGDFNQALMELGATLCLPRQPACGACPIAVRCVARRQGRQAELPAAGVRARQRDEHVFAFAVYSEVGGGEDHDRAQGHIADRRWLVARRPEHGLLGGLWEFPMAPGEPGDDPAMVAEAAFDLRVDRPATLAAVTHVFTHIRLTAVPVVGRVRGDQVDLEARGGAGRYAAWRWVELAELVGATLPSSVLMDKLVERVGREGTRSSSAPGGSFARP